jgi:predicted dehydrogenase
MADDPLGAGDVFTHAEAYSRSPATHLVAVCDTDPEAARRCADRWNVEQWFTDPGEMMRSAAPEIVSVCTPDATHYPVARAIIEVGGRLRALLVEKPLATSSADAEALVDLARRHGIVLAAMMMRRYAENFRGLRALLETGELGQVRAVSGWFTKGTLHNGVHWFDSLRFLAGEVAWVQALDMLGEAGPDPTLDVIMGLERGGLATLRAASSEHFTIFEMSLLTDRARIAIRDSGHAIEIEEAGASPRYSGYRELLSAPRDLGTRRDLALHAIEDLASAVRLGRRPASTGEDAVAALRIAETALRAVAAGTPLAVDRTGPASPYRDER